MIDLNASEVIELSDEDDDGETMDNRVEDHRKTLLSQTTETMELPIGREPESMKCVSINSYCLFKKGVKPNVYFLFDSRSCVYTVCNFKQCFESLLFFLKNYKVAPKFLKF